MVEMERPLLPIVRDHIVGLMVLRLSRPSVRTMIALRPDTSFKRIFARDQGIIHRSITAGLEAVDGILKRGMILGKFLDIIIMGIEGYQAGLIPGPHLINIGLCGSFGAIQLAADIHAAGNIDDQHGR